MPITTDHSAPSRPVNIRLSEDERNLIDQAAKVLGKTRTNFMVEAARRAAEDALLDQTYIRVDEKNFVQYSKMLDHPPSGAGFERLINAPKPWR